MQNISEDDDRPLYPTCMECGYQNTNFPGRDTKMICIPCQSKRDEDHEEFHGI